MPITLDGTNGITTPNETVTGNISAATYNNGQLAGNRNKIINGAMMIDQRNAGAAVTINSSTQYTIDRFWGGKAGTLNNFTVQQSSVAPSGLTKSTIITMGTGVTPATTDYAIFGQAIEGFNCADLSWGTASAKSITLSFWVYCSVTGTFGVSFRNASTTRSYVTSYTISSANTWTYITLTIPGDTAGVWTTDNTVGISLLWDLGVGPTYSTTAGSWQAGNLFGLTGGTKLAATTGATFYITGVQLEKGATATPFENRLYGTELALCQRYFSKSGSIDVAVPTNGTAYANLGFTAGNFSAYSSNSAYLNFKLPVSMRSAPTMNFISTSLSAGSGVMNYFNGSTWNALSAMAAQQVTTESACFNVTGTWTTNQTLLYYGAWTANAEL